MAAAVLLGTLPEAEAGPRVLRPGTRPWVFIGGFGPSIDLDGDPDRYWYWDRYRGYYYRDRWWRGTQFKLMQEIGYHFSGDSEGAALGASLEEAFGNGYFRMEMGPKFWYDIQPASDLSLYLAPEGRLGFAFMTDPFDPFFNIQIGFNVKLLLNDRGVVFLRLITVDFLIGEEFYPYWDIMMGGGVTWD